MSIRHMSITSLRLYDSEVLRWSNSSAGHCNNIILHYGQGNTSIVPRKEKFSIV